MFEDLNKQITSIDSSVNDETASLKPINGLSHVVGEKRSDLLNLTIPQLLKRTASRYGSREAVIFVDENIRWTFSELDRQTDALATGLLALGLRKGDRFGIWSPNRIEWIAIQYASAKIGLILVNINPAYRLSELEYALNKSGCKAVLIASQFKSSNYVEMMQTLLPELNSIQSEELYAAKVPALRTVIRMGSERTSGMLNYEEILELGDPAHYLQLDRYDQELQPDDAINIQFTSGTTGAPKGATLTHANIVNNGHFTVKRMGFRETDRLCIPVPMYHCFGMVMGSLGCVSKGAAMVFPGESFDPQSTLFAIQSERCTAVYGVPTMFVAMLEHANFSDFDLTSLRTGIMAGAPCPAELMKKVNSDMHMPDVTIAYGMTETSPVSFQSHVDDPFDRRVGTVGRVHPHVEVKIIDVNGQTVRINEQGELCTRGYSVMKGYWEDEEKTQEAVDNDGWIHTGDLAVLDGAGYCTIVGRVKDMVIRGGENVYPREIEEFLFKHPAILDVQVFGVPDRKLGEELCAWIVPKSGLSISAADVRDYCKDQIAHFKIPRHIRFKESLPMTVTGKPQKFLMREAMMREFDNGNDAGS